MRNIDKFNKSVQSEILNASVELSTELTAEIIDQKDI